MLVGFIIYALASQALCESIRPPKCGEFEQPTDCADYPVEPYDSGTKCQPGCKCIDKYLRDLNGTCVPVPSDLKCKKNEEPTLCVKVCFPQICNVDPLEFSMTCKPGPCQPGCQCIKGHVRDELDNCIPKEKCPPVKTPCTFDECSPTCSIRNPPNCSQANNSCSCSDGFVLSEPGGQCVPTYECSVYENCKGDKNARYSDCPNKCKSTCRDPEPKCVSECDSFGCECKPGYILNDDGKCILPQDCPGGNPCKKYEEFSYCKVECAPSFCPQDDFRGVVLCLPQYPCPSGCVCKRNYRRLIGDDKRCVLASECPAVNCTRQFEVWNPCTETRFSDSCSNLKRTPVERTSSDRYCQPQCVCAENYLRNDTDVCVPIKNCPKYSAQ